jgi:tetratricopeptide (TPR) repeat protein
MATRTPIVRQVSWLVALPSLLVLAAVAMLGLYLGGNTGLIVAVACFLAYSIGMRSLIAREHRRGIRLVRSKQFGEAIPHFERSFEFFDRHRWLDDWRGLVLLSSSRASYREMALLNVAFCLSQLGDGARAAETYQRCLELFPESGMAEAALRMLGAATRPGA